MDVHVRLDAAQMEALRDEGAIASLAVSGDGILTPARARRLRGLKSVRRLEIRARVLPTRAAVNELARIPGLEELFLFGVSGGGAFADFDGARDLRTFRCDGVTAADLREIVKAPALETLAVQVARLKPGALRALAAAPKLRSLDLEHANFTDDMAAIIAQSPTIETLYLGGTPLTGVGLERLSAMAALRELDIWATRVVPEDLDLLQRCPHLEWASVGGNGMSAAPVIDALVSHKTLKNVWLDGVDVTDEQRARLIERFEAPRITVDSDEGDVPAAPE